MPKPVAVGFAALGVAVLLAGNPLSLSAGFGISKTRVMLPRLQPPSVPILAERVALLVSADSADVSAAHADVVRNRIAEAMEAWKLHRVVDPREDPGAVFRVSLRGMETAIRDETEMETKYVKIGEKEEWDEKKKKMVTKDVMGNRKEPVTYHVIEGRVQGAAQVEGAGSGRPEDVSFRFWERSKYLTDFPDEVRTMAGLRDYLVAEFANKAITVATFGPAPVEALLASDGELKTGNALAQAGLFKDALEEWNRRTFKGGKEAARLHNVGVATEARAYALAPFEAEHAAQLQQAKELYRRAFMMDSNEKYFADPLKRIEVSLDFAQRAAAVKKDMDAARNQAGAKPPSPITVTSPVSEARVKDPITITGRAPAGRTVFFSSLPSGSLKKAPWSLTKWTEPDASGNFALTDFDFEGAPPEFSLVAYHVNDKDEWINTVVIPLRLAK